MVNLDLDGELTRALLNWWDSKMLHFYEGFPGITYVSTSLKFE